MTIRVPDLDGIEATRLITAEEDLSGVKVLVLTTYETDEHIVEALGAGVSGFLPKDSRPAELLDAIRGWRAEWADRTGTAGAHAGRARSQQLPRSSTRWGSAP